MSYLHAWGMSLYLLTTNAPTDNENGVVFSAAEYFSSQLNNTNSIQSVDYLTQLLKNLQVERDGKIVPGIFNRYDTCNQLPSNQINEISHDNMTAIAALSYELGLDYHVNIYNYGKQNLFRYDNAHPDKPRVKRTFAPRDIIYYSYLGGSVLAKLALPYVYVTQMVSCAKKYDVRPQWWKRWFMGAQGYNKYLATSGKQMAFIRLMPLRHTWHGKLAFDMCTKLVNNSVGGWKAVFDTYYKNSDHPVRKVWNKQDKKDIFITNKSMGVKKLN